MKALRNQALREIAFSLRKKKKPLTSGCPHGTIGTVERDTGNPAHGQLSPDVR